MYKTIFKLFIFVYLGVIALYGEEQEQKVEVVAKHLESTETNVNAKDGVVVYYQDSVIKADRATYDKKTQVLTLDGNVEMMGYQGAKQKSQHVTINTTTNEVKFQELFFMSAEDIWLYAKNAKRNDHNYTFGNSMLSSCDVNDPLWKMYFNRSVYDSDDKYMKLYDTTVYLLDIPVFYSPYLAFSTDNQRRSGLLFPLFGYSGNSGFLYEQPIFWAISPSMDMEFNPQIRTQRSLGMYATYRFADSAYSQGKLRTGYFRDKKSYQLEEGNAEQGHYGVEFMYDASKLFTRDTQTEYEDGLYVNAIYLNDIDYINLQKSTMHSLGLTPLQESRLNYYLHNDTFYTGLYANYFIDTRKQDNDETLQQLPSLQIHKYLDHLIWDNLTYRADIRMRNLERNTGSTLNQIEGTIPLELNYAFFDDYLNLSLGESLYYSKYYFGNDTFSYDAFEYYSNIHKVRLFSDLTKTYDGFVHVLQPSLEYSVPGNVMQSPVDFALLSDSQKELFDISLPEEHVTLGLGNYFYDTDANLKFYDRVFQTYYIDRAYEFADLGNEMQYNWKNWQFYNYVVYAHEFNKIREASSRITLKEDEYNFSIGHTYKQKLPDDQTIFVPANNVHFNFSYSVNTRVKMRGGLVYGLDDTDERQLWVVGGSYTRDCWSIDVSMRHGLMPRPVGATMENNIYVQLNFIPFAKVGSTH